MLRSWEKLPDYMKMEEVYPYYEILKKRKISLFFKTWVRFYCIYGNVCDFIPDIIDYFNFN